MSFDTLKRWRHVWLALVAALASSCTSPPPVPEWIRKTPPADSQYTYFTGSSSAYDSAAALNDATSSLIAGIMQYWGVSVSMSSSAEVRASLDEYQALMTQTVRTESKGRLAGFEVVEKYIHKDPTTGRYTAHILARYETRELLKEKVRIEALFREKLDAVAVPEERGDAAAAEGRLFAAIRSYAEAMSAAGRSDIENAQIKFERNAKKASALAAALKLATISGQGTSVHLGETLPSFVVRLVTNRKGKEEGIPGVPLVIYYPRRLASGRIGTGTARIFTDEAGIATFEVPAVDLAGQYRVTVQPDFAGIDELLTELPSWTLPYIDAFESELRGIVTSISYHVSSRTKDIPIAVAAYTRDPAVRGTLEVGIFISSLQEALLKEGFVVLGAEIPEGKGPDIDNLRAVAPPHAQRFSITGIDFGPVTRDGAYFIATVFGSTSLFDLASGSTLLSASKSAQGIGLSEADAIANALRVLGGQSVARELMALLPQSF